MLMRSLWQGCGPYDPMACRRRALLRRVLSNVAVKAWHIVTLVLPSNFRPDIVPRYIHLKPHTLLHTIVFSSFGAGTVQSRA